MYLLSICTVVIVKWLKKKKRKENYNKSTPGNIRSELPYLCSDPDGLLTEINNFFVELANNLSTSHTSLLTFY